MAADVCVMALAYAAAYGIPAIETGRLPTWGVRGAACTFATVAAVQLACLALAGCYRLLWRFVTIMDVPRFVLATAGSTLALAVLRWVAQHYAINHIALRFSGIIIVLNGVLVLGGLLAARLLPRVLADHEPLLSNGRVTRVLLVGAGSAGSMALREMQRQRPVRMRAVGFMDDDPAKRGAVVHGARVWGGIDELPALIRKLRPEEVVVTIAKPSRELIRRVVAHCEAQGARVRIIPSFHELVEGTAKADRVREIDIVDLLGRNESGFDDVVVREFLNGRRVMVTGAGGTIGGELSRQALRSGAAQVALVERSENALYEIERELRGMAQGVEIAPFLADVADEKLMARVFAEARPDVVLHAAAHKHVPLMERNPAEAVRNNFLATQSLAELASNTGASMFMLISTDKAVNPASVMGASKRLAEMAVCALAGTSKTRFAAVRFGNVLGSSGSVVPLFREQIRKGGPVTVTHPDMKRYFMTVQEAVSLVLHAGAVAKGGEVFVLDMGEPVRIVELAESMIRLSGFKPHDEIPIVFTGIRPGEKLFEELDVSEASAIRTENARIFIGRTAHRRDIAALCDAARRVIAEGPQAVRDFLREGVAAQTKNEEQK